MEEDYIESRIKNTALIRGKEVSYDICAGTKKAYPEILDKVYLGRGKIYSVDGIVQSEPFGSFYFWNLRGKSEETGSQ